MKYLKTYEFAKSKNVYWEITLRRPYFNIALKKIGVPLEIIKKWCDTYIDDPDIEVFVTRIFSDDDFEWGLLFPRLQIPPKSLLHTPLPGRPDSYLHDAAFMGKVKVEDWEIDAEKYNL